MSSLIESFQNATLTILRTDPGSFVAGDFVAGASNDVPDVKAVVQQATPHELTMFQEGRRGGESIVVFTDIELKITDESDSTRGDRIVYLGKKYEVHKVENWSNGTDLPHYKSFCFLEDDGRGADV